MNALDSVLPPDRTDRTPMDDALRALLHALESPRSNERPSVTLTLGPTEWAKVRTYYQRPYQRKPTSEFAVYLQEGTVWFERAEEESEAAAPVATEESERERRAKMRALFTAELEDMTLSPRRRDLAREVLLDLNAEVAAAPRDLVPGQFVAVPVGMSLEAAQRAGRSEALHAPVFVHPEAAAAIEAARVERQAWTPDAVAAKGAIPVELAESGPWRETK